MSDWKFASISGYLTWTSPSVPDGGIELFSELSPTLIIALQEQGDTLPVDYIKLLSITSVSLPPGKRGIELIREGAAPTLLVAKTPEEAHDWYTMIQTAIGDAAGSRVKARPPLAAAPAAAPPPSASNDASSGPSSFDAANPAPADSGTGALNINARTRGGSTGSLQSLGLQNRAVEQRQPTPVATGNTESAGGSRQGSDTGSLRLQLGGSGTTPPLQQQQRTGSTTQIPTWVQSTPKSLQGSDGVGNTTSSSQKQQWSAASPVVQAPLPATMPGAAPAAPRAGSETNPASSGTHHFRPLSEITGVPTAKTTTTTTYTDLRPARSASSSQHNDVQFFRPPVSSSAQPQQPHQQQPPSQAWGPILGAQPTWTPLSKSTGGVATGSHPSPQPQSSNNVANNAAAATNNSASSFSATGGARPLPPATSGSMPPYQASVSPIHPDDPRAQSEMPYAPRYDDMHTTHQSAMGLRKRAGMLVDVPPNPQVNRNNAPNVSAIWKEWSGPDGVLYVCHEPSGTLQRRNAETGEFETLVDGTHEIHPDDMALHPYTGDETAVDLNQHVIKHVERYTGGRSAGGPSLNVSSPSVYRSEPVMSPRGQYSPTRRSQLNALAAPRQSQTAYNGRRVHHLTLGAEDESAIEHKIQLLGGSGLKWDPQSGKVVAPAASNPGDIGTSTLHRQWEHVRRILMQGRYFKKHALRTTTSSFRFVFLTSDNAYVVCVPTSEVLFHVNDNPKTFQTMTETIQYYGPESRAIALNTITHVSLGSDEQFVRNRAATLIPKNTFCIVSRTHAFILECNTSEEAKYFADAWTFFLYHSKPTNTARQRTPQMKNPVTFGTRGGIAF